MEPCAVSLRHSAKDIKALIELLNIDDKAHEIMETMILEGLRQCYPIMHMGFDTNTHNTNDALDLEKDG
jgi:hypothetical protein